jgi:hypothetical protein
MNANCKSNSPVCIVNSSSWSSAGAAKKENYQKDFYVLTNLFMQETSHEKLTLM